MIELHMWPTPNAHKVTLFLEETGLPYRTVEVNIGAGDQFKPEFLAISPNNKMPAIVDPDGPDGRPISVFESGAILLYLAEKTGRFLPADARGRYEVLQWLMFQMAGVGPMFGQVHHFYRFAPDDIAYAKDRYAKEQRRLYATLDKQLSANAYVAGADYSLADIAIYPWVARHDWHPVDLAGDYPDVKRWYDAVSARPAVERGMAVPAAT